MRSRVEGRDWGATSLGPIGSWPVALRTGVDLMLAQAYPTNICAGPDRILIYNDAYARLIDGKDPDALGRDVREAFAEVPDFARTLDRAFAGEAVLLKDAYYPFYRDGGIKDAWMDVSYSPLRDGAGAVIGAFVIHHDTTKRVLAERRRDAAEAGTRAEAERRALLFRLLEDQRGVVDADSIMRAAAEAVGRYLDVDRTGFYEIADDDTLPFGPSWTNDGVPALTEVWAAPAIGGAYLAEMVAGRTVGVADTSSDPLTAGSRFDEIDARAVVGAPIVRGGRWHAGLYVGHSAGREWTDGELRLVRAVADQTWDAVERARAQATLKENEAHWRTLTEGVPVLVWRSCELGEWTWSSPQWRAFTGQTQEESQGRGWMEPVYPEDRPTTLKAWDEARGHGLLDVDFRLRRASDGAYIWHQARSSPVYGEDGRIVEWLGTTTDIQQLKELQERQSVLVAELQHRTRNLIAVVRSVADKTLRGSASLAVFQQRFRERLGALARVQGLLSRAGHGRIAFDELLDAELSAHGVLDGAQVELDGPGGIGLRSGSVQTFALALHELTTNALKYGALAQPGGRLRIGWRVTAPDDDARRCLTVEWRESGVTMPGREAGAQGGGYGRELIERALPYQLKATTSYELGEDGVRCTIALPIAGDDGPEDGDDE